MATYTVREGDSLSIIARDVLGAMGRWPEIAQLNNIVAPYTIFPGQMLQLPGAAEVTTDLITTPTTTTPTPVARAAINWQLIALAIAGVALIWYGMRK